MNPDLLLRLAYGFNIVVLAPVLFGLYAHRGSGQILVLGGGIANVDGLRLLLASLWSAVLILSAFGLHSPRAMIPLLAFQVIYKALFLATYVVPLATRGQWSAVPMGPTVVFAIIVVAWPFVILRAFA